MRRRVHATVAFVTLAAVFLALPSGAHAACGGGPLGPNPELPRLAGRTAEIVVFGRARTSENRDGFVTLEVLRAYKGNPGPTIEIAHDALTKSCLHFYDVEVGERLLYAGPAVNEPGDDPFSITWRKDGGFWGFHFDQYKSVSQIVALMGLLPETSTEASKAGGSGFEAGAGLIAAAGWLALVVALQRRRSSAA